MHNTIKALTETLVDKIAYVGLAANDGVLAGVANKRPAISQEVLGQEFRREVEWLEELSDAELKINVTELNTRGPDADKSQDPNIPPFALVGLGKFNELS